MDKKAIKNVENILDSVCELQCWKARAVYAIRLLEEELKQYGPNEEDLRDRFSYFLISHLINFLRIYHAIPNVFACGDGNSFPSECGNTDSQNSESEGF